ncbi:MAG: nucleotide exchange factor GrpE [Clostridiales bacterium]|nr:nucleotide exchange factor GrpE [Clostridiales bacterium]
MEEETARKDDEIDIDDIIDEECAKLGDASQDDKTSIDYKAQNAELLDKLQRSLAEFDNFRKRTIKEKASMYDDGVRDVVEKLLPTADSFERALAAADDKESGFYKGVEMIYRQLISAFDAIGVEAIRCSGEPFDPNAHNAVAHIEDESLGENVVAEELQKGYKYKDKIIRYAAVKVAN